MSENQEEIEKENDPILIAGGIYINISILNSGESDISLNFNNANDETCKAFALFLSMTENGGIYAMILNRIKEIIKQKNLDQNKIIKTIFEYKKDMDLNIDQPAVLPRNVFSR